MGALGLEGWRRRPQGKGCLLLAVAGATSLVTLLLAVPITVLAVLVVVPQKQGLGPRSCRGRTRKQIPVLGFRPPTS
ncbi:lymphotoxin-beta isoform X4 [Molossus molossus]|uniref:lymphotoxin-beta isoform X4 n=1 Tax=Molossus molossus TaxID=27622 RepID=UPI001745E59C|nr:lymphotoxin-beta isoform X4 [Molossus molossus]